MTLKITGLNKSRGALNKFLKVANNPDKVLNKLSEIGKNEILKAHDGVMGIDHVLGIDSTSVNVQSDIKVNIETGYNESSIVASGYNFLFHEFGAGIEHNSPRTWENVLNIQIPEGISPIGQYGKKLGSNPTWRYTNPDGNKVLTSGYPAVHGFATAINVIVANTDKIIREVQNE